MYYKKQRQIQAPRLGLLQPCASTEKFHYNSSVQPKKSPQPPTKGLQPTLAESAASHFSNCRAQKPPLDRALHFVSVLLRAGAMVPPSLTISPQRLSPSPLKSLPPLPQASLLGLADAMARQWACCTDPPAPAPLLACF